MKQRIAVIGAGVSGLTCGVVLAEHGYQVSILAEETGRQTTSAAAGAIWYPYDCEPKDKVIAWALKTYDVLLGLAQKSGSGVSMIELVNFSRTPPIEIPDWAGPLGARSRDAATFVVNVPLTDTTIYLDYLAKRFADAGGEIVPNTRLEKLEDVDLVRQRTDSPGRAFDVVINCSGFGAKTLVHDADLEPHRGQVAIVPKIATFSGAMVCDDAPLMYAIQRANDCLFGGTNELSDDRGVDPATTSRIVSECSSVLKIDAPKVIDERVGIRPFRKSGVRIEHRKLADGRSVVHNYGHGGSGFTLSWGCADEVLRLVSQIDSHSV